ncbi:hypothetical protein PIB30_032531 [Stylosanthes scabra]|uniref:Uncharacterized protein n=1 Tax=Stylosanthes scabra TaxID=79078 RepID=A0ABU6YAL6_9FABA|nr:hypothetical protein [Stylosanthes scabra]
MNNKRLETEKNLQQVMEKQGRDIAEMRKQVTLWTRNTSAREAYTCWAHQQANPNLSEIPITKIPDLMQTNAEKEDICSMGASNQIMGQVLPPKPIHKSRCRCGLHLRFSVSNHHIVLLISSKVVEVKEHKPRLMKNEERKLEEQEMKNWSILDRASTLRRGAQSLGVPSHNLGSSNPCLGVEANA